MNTVTPLDAFKAGILKRGAAYGITDADLVGVRCEAERILSNAVEMQQLFCKAGATVLARAGMDDTLEYGVLCKCASSGILLPNEVRDAFVQPVQDVLEKRAGGWADAVANIPGTLMAATLALGAASGGAYYLARRDMATDDAETEAKIEQARIYRETAKKIVEEMRRKAKEKGLSAPDKAFVY